MKCTWRTRLSKKSTIIVSSLFMLCGCQTWSPSNWGVPAGTRVPPPPTGSYQHQGAYYNNPATGTATSVSAPPTSGVPAAPGKTTTQIMPNQSMPGGATVVPASAVAPLNQLNPRTQISSGSSSVFEASKSTSTVGFPSTRGQVSTAGYTDNGSGMAEVVSASSLQAPADMEQPLQNGNIEANASSDGANLQWK